ncbi:MAG: sugar phosphate isomerase/epimerase [Desulfohalobiaceae bacterium]|nr:sugar phosphate isomerase/epimerase [Desulfohalobiaceae bacterium]
MGNFFVYLPIRHIAEDHSCLDSFLRENIHPELALDAMSLDHLDLDWHQGLATVLFEAGLTCGIHLPYHDLQPGSLDDLILDATRQRLQKAIKVAKIYDPKYLVGHAYFIPLYNDLFSKWLNRAVDTWNQVLSSWPGHPVIFLENVRENDPRPLSDLLCELADHNLIRCCLDVGHWSSYGGGGQYQNLSKWIQTLSPYLGHLHLHDNDGIADKHLGLGQGMIPWEELFFALELLELTPSIALETHSKESFCQSCSFMRKHLDWFTRLGIDPENIPDM